MLIVWLQQACSSVCPEADMADGELLYLELALLNKRLHTEEHKSNSQTLHHSIPHLHPARIRILARLVQLLVTLQVAVI